MRVLFLCYRGNPYCGGQGIYLYYLTRELARLGVEIDILVGPPYPDNIDNWATVYRIENLNLFFEMTKKMPLDKLKRIFSFWNFIDYILTRFHIFPEMETFSLRSFFFLRKLLKKKRYDLIHDIQCLGWGLLPMKGYGIPLISTVHHPLRRDRDADFLVDKSLWDYFTTIMFYPLTMQRVIINRLDRVITSSEEGIEELNRSFGLNSAKINAVLNGMDVDEFTCTGEAREERSLLYVGNTEDHKKGLIYLFEALKMLPEDITLTLVDEGPPNRLSAITIIRKLGLEHRVHFTGKIESKELVHLYSTKTLLVLSSLYEGFGLPAAEAMSCEMPVVATTAGALKEVVSSDCGILVPPKDSNALKDAILKLIDDKELRIKLGKEGKKRAGDNFAWPVAAKKTLDVYRDVIQEYSHRR